tara:strand:+ start:35 stop:700 length:666 start_codon:yes stop_codon:yes gene_type:complete
MNSPFNKSFISKSPLRRHKGLQRQLKRAKKGKIGAEGQGGVDYELVEDLQKQIQEAKAAHNTNQRTEEGDARVREDEAAARGSGIEMKSPLHGYVDASDQVDSNPSTAHMWTKVFDSMAVAGQAIVKARSTPKAKAEHQEKRVEKRNKRGVKKGEGTIDSKGVYTATAGKEDSKFNTRTTKIGDKAAENRKNIGKNSSNDVLAKAYKDGKITLEQYKSLIS